MSRVGEALKAARLQSGMTQKALAKKLGVAEKYINEVEMGRKVVQENFIDKVAKVLKIDLNNLKKIYNFLIYLILLFVLLLLNKVL